MSECPIYGCDKSTVDCDPDWMMGHLLTDHGLEFTEANTFMKYYWPPVSEWEDCPEPEVNNND